MPSPGSADGATVPRYELHPVANSWSIDPHLQDSLISSKDPAWTPSPAIGHVQDDRFVIDVIARLKGKTIPEKLQEICTIGDIVTGVVALEDIEEVHGQVVSLKSATNLFLNLHHSVPATSCNPAAFQKTCPEFPGLDGSGVVVGIVDVGCDFQHRNFCTGSGDTRLLYLWDQSDPKTESGNYISPQPYGYGREFDAAAINEALQTSDPYGKLGYTPQAGVHGTHVMDIAAGNGREPNLIDGKPSNTAVKSSPPGVAPNALLVFVHLKTDEEAVLGNSRHLLEAVDYIFRKADELNLPAVVNLSLSTTGGPHDGKTLVELGFENLLRKPGRAIVVSAGNSFAKEGHVADTAKKDAPFTLSWRVDPLSDRNEMEAWYAGGSALAATLVAPDGTRLGPVALGETYELRFQGRPVGRVSHRKDDPNNNDNQLDIRLPTPEPDNSLGFAVPRAETWKVELSTDAEGVPFHAWIEQSDRGMARFGEETSTSSTLGSICCGPSTLTVGAFDTAENAALGLPWSGTAAGPTRNGQNKPELSAPGSKILAARAQGGTTTMSGTSMAAAHVTGLVAILYQLAERAGLGRLDTKTLRDAILTSTSPVVDPKLKPQLGQGKLMGSAAVRALLARQQPTAPPPSVSIELKRDTKAKKKTKRQPNPPPVTEHGSNGRELPDNHPK